VAEAVGVTRQAVHKYHAERLVAAGVDVRSVMLERLVREARAVVAEAREEARGLGSPTVEAEHLLLALSRDASRVAGDVLRRARLDHATVLVALESEFERSLEAVGVSAAAFNLPAVAQRRARPVGARRPNRPWGG
jgi:ATP-dependent Clp protease ATP-binding subunit ClpA